MKVKICGLTTLQDAETVVAAGADYLGFIFYPPSKRAITPEAAQTITRQLRQQADCPLLVGVFVNETAAAMQAILAQCQLDLAQLSGEEVPSLVGDEKSPLYGRAYKAIRPASLAEAEAESEWFRAPTRREQPLLPSILIDTYHTNLRGGTGQTGDWEISAQIAQQIPRLMLAGGLTADNVAEAVAQVRPFAVDVASGVEASPGHKDPNLVRAFIANAKT